MEALEGNAFHHSKKPESPNPYDDKKSTPLLDLEARGCILTKSLENTAVCKFNSPHCQVEIVDSQRLFSSLAVGIPTDEPQLQAFSH